MTSDSRFTVFEFDPLTLEVLSERVWSDVVDDQDIPWRNEIPTPRPDLDKGWPVVNQSSRPVGDYRSTMGVIGATVTSVGDGRADYAVLYNEEAAANYAPGVPSEPDGTTQVLTWYTQDGYAITWNPNDYSVMAFWTTSLVRNRPPDTAKALASYSQGFFRSVGI